MGQEKIDKVDISDYLAIEQEDKVRYEFHDGQLIRMAGGSVSHSDICNNVAYALTAATRATGKCKAFNSEMKLEVRRNKKYVYADAGVSCPGHKESDHLTGAITNPRLVVEVLSGSSVGYDMGRKMQMYFSIPSIKEYLIIYQDRAEVMLYRRHGTGDLFGVHAAEGIRSSIELTSIDSMLKLADIYYGIDFSETK